MSEDDMAWKEAHLNNIGKLLDTFNSAFFDGPYANQLGDIQTAIDGDKGIQDLLSRDKLQKNKQFDVEKTLSKIHGNESVKAASPNQNVI